MIFFGTLTYNKSQTKRKNKPKFGNTSMCLSLRTDWYKCFYEISMLKCQFYVYVLSKFSFICWTYIFIACRLSQLFETLSKYNNIQSLNVWQAHHIQLNSLEIEITEVKIKKTYFIVMCLQMYYRTRIMKKWNRNCDICVDYVFFFLILVMFLPISFRITNIEPLLAEEFNSWCCSVCSIRRIHLQQQQQQKTSFFMSLTNFLCLINWIV